jgi:hypothetical protein
LAFQILAIKINSGGSQFGQRGFLNFFLAGEDYEEEKKSYKKKL